MTALYPTINQYTYWGVGDPDECATIATFWAARASGFKGTLPTVTEFKQAAGVRPQFWTLGLSPAQVIQGVAGTSLVTAGAYSLDAESWTDFAAQMYSGGFASVATNSALLPADVRYGFMGLHQVGVTFSDGTWYIANPLAPNGSRPQAISEADLKKAILGFGGWGTVNGVMFKGKGATAAPLPQPVWAGPAFLTPPPSPAIAGIPAFAAPINDAALTAEFYRAKHPMKNEMR